MILGHTLFHQSVFAAVELYRIKQLSNLNVTAVNYSAGYVFCFISSSIKRVSIFLNVHSLFHFISFSFFLKN